MLKSAVHWFAALTILTFTLWHHCQRARITLLNNDELTHISVANRPFFNIPEAAAKHAHPPLFFLALHQWASVWGGSVPATRLLPAVFFLMAGVLAFLWIRRLLGPDPALAALILTCGSSALFTRMAVEIRSYSMMLALIFAALYTLERVRDDRSRAGWGWLAAFAGVGVLAVLTHYSAALAMALIGVWAFFRFDCQRRHPRLLSVFLVVILLEAMAFCLIHFYSGVDMAGIQSCHKYLKNAYPACDSFSAAHHLQDLGNAFIPLKLLLPLTFAAWGAWWLERRGNGPVVFREEMQFTRGMLTLTGTALFLAVLLGYLKLYPLTFDRHGTYLFPFLLAGALVPFLPLRGTTPSLGFGLGTLLIAAVLMPDLHAKKRLSGWFHRPFAERRVTEILKHVPENGAVFALQNAFAPLSSLGEGPYHHVQSWIKGRVFLASETLNPDTELFCAWIQTLKRRNHSHLWLFPFPRGYFHGSLNTSGEDREFIPLNRGDLIRLDLSKFPVRPCSVVDQRVDAFERECRKAPTNPGCTGPSPRRSDTVSLRFES